MYITGNKEEEKFRNEINREIKSKKVDCEIKFITGKDGDNTAILNFANHIQINKAIELFKRLSHLDAVTCLSGGIAINKDKNWVEYYVGYNLDNENLLELFGKIKAFDKEIIRGKAFVVFNQTSTLKFEIKKWLPFLRTGIKYKVLGTGEIEETGVDIHRFITKENKNINRFIIQGCGQHILKVVYDSTDDIKSSIKGLNELFKERGYEIISIDLENPEEIPI